LPIEKEIPGGLHSGKTSYNPKKELEGGCRNNYLCAVVAIALLASPFSLLSRIGEKCGLDGEKGAEQPHDTQKIFIQT